MTARTPCRDCGALILLAVKTNGGRRIALNPDPDPTGNVELHADGRAVVHRTAPLTGVDLYTAHHATCPNAADFRRAHTPKRTT